MAAVTNVTTLTVPKSNINGAISKSSFSSNAKGSKINQINLTEIKNAIDKLETYAAKVNNCGNCNLISSNSTSCQKTAYYTKTNTNSLPTYVNCAYYVTYSYHNSL